MSGVFALKARGAERLAATARAATGLALLAPAPRVASMLLILSEKSDASLVLWVLAHSTQRNTQTHNTQHTAHGGGVVNVFGK